MSRESYLADIKIESEIEESAKKGGKLIDRIGGRDTIARVHQIFYDKLYDHYWIGLFFVDIERSHIEEQQTDFFTQLMGGPKNYSGRMPIDAHVHMFITEEIFETRHQLLKESLQEAGIPEKEQEDWLRIDQAFKKVLVKKSITECKGRFKTDPIVSHEDPLKRSA